MLSRKKVTQCTAKHRTACAIGAVAKLIASPSAPSAAALLVGCLPSHRYGARDYISVVLLSVGIVVFSLGSGSDESFEFPWFGVATISGALMADALIGNVQEKVLQSFDASATEMIFYTKLIGLAYILTVLIAMDELAPAFAYCWTHPIVYLYMAAFAVVGCIGENFVMTLLKARHEPQDSAAQCTAHCPLHSRCTADGPTAVLLCCAVVLMLFLPSCR
jgi:hypothetical protein